MALEKFRILYRVTITMHVQTHVLFVCPVQLVCILNQQAKIVDTAIIQGMLNVREKVSDLIITHPLKIWPWATQNFIQEKHNNENTLKF